MRILKQDKEAYHGNWHYGYGNTEEDVVEVSGCRSYDHDTSLPIAAAAIKLVKTGESATIVNYPLVVEVRELHA
ncbi:unnamed protein product [Dibothriocephalus latus]|uniref:Uncharacterized protein n=1 Tax=Dibothriocephalus latus TaxID=60516 RepID=A0A3P6VAV5_DIBLA|nr:unnamed protein product [Dibothriocephalus latus]